MGKSKKKASTSTSATPPQASAGSGSSSSNAAQAQKLAAAETTVLLVTPGTDSASLVVPKIEGIEPGDEAWTAGGAGVVDRVTRSRMYIWLPHPEPTKVVSAIRGDSRMRFDGPIPVETEVLDAAAEEIIEQEVEGSPWENDHLGPEILSEEELMNMGMEEDEPAWAGGQEDEYFEEDLSGGAIEEDLKEHLEDKRVERENRGREH